MSKYFFKKKLINIPTVEVKMTAYVFPNVLYREASNLPYILGPKIFI